MSGTLRRYVDLVEVIGKLYPLPQYFNGLVALLLLYHTTGSLKQELKEPKKVESFHENFRKFAEKELNASTNNESRFLLSTLCFSLSKMKKLFELVTVAESDDNDRPAGDVPRLYSISFTETEENWLQNKFAELKVIFSAVLPTKTMFHQAIGLLSGNPHVSKDFSANWMAIMRERVKRVLISHPEFQNLGQREQEYLLNKNLKHSAIVPFLRVNVAETGKAQLKSIMGIVDTKDSTWERNFPFDLDSLTVVYLHDPSVHLGKMDAASAQQLAHLLQDVSDMCINDHTFQLLVLLSLVDTEDLPQNLSYANIFELRNTYLRIFQRKLAAANCSFIDYAKFRSTLSKVRIVANLIESYITNELYC